MTDTEYKYDDQLSVAKNIATALFAIANELKKVVDNNSDQSLNLHKLLEKHFSEISVRIKNLSETVNSHSSSEDRIDIDPVIEQLNNISSSLESIYKILKKHFFGEDYTGRSYSDYD